MRQALYRVRLGVPAEIEALVAIDDDATVLYREQGIAVELGPAHEFALQERERWLGCLQRGSAWVATEPGDDLVGFAAVGSADGGAYLDQLAVRRSHMRRGIGSALVREAVRWSEARSAPLWLTTYDPVPFNRPFYERAGFQVVPQAECGPEVLGHLAQQRRFLPHPQWRVAMRRLPLPVGRRNSEMQGG